MELWGEMLNDLIKLKVSEKMQKVVESLKLLEAEVQFEFKLTA